MATANTDRNLLFGILALQMDFIRRDALIKAMNAWVLEKAKGLGQILVEQKALGSDRHALLEALVQEHLKQHGNNPEQSLAAVSSAGLVREELKQIADPDLHASLARVSVARQAEAGSWGTNAPSVGSSTSSGLRFRILRPHARGGLGQVSVARDEELHREVALKEIQDRHADDPDSRSRFLLEAEITGGLEHPGIVPVYGLGHYGDGRPYYAMRFIRGDSLKEAIERFHKAEGPKRDPGERTLELRQLLGRFVDVCNTMAYAHSRGVLHRDLKPGNIMLGKYGETLVVDWGLAKAMDKPESVSASDEGQLQPSGNGAMQLTRTGAAVGTPAYMSPEQAAGRLDLLGPASDVYSLGATLYCLLTRRAPVEDADLGAALRKVQQGDFPPPRQVKPGVSPALDAVCLKAMALKPKERYGSPRELADEIEHWLADEPVSAYREPWRLRLGRWRRRHPTLVTTAAMLLLVVIGGGVLGAVALGREKAKGQTLARVETLHEASPLAVPLLLRDLEPVRQDALPRLRKLWAQHALTDGQRLRIGLALLPVHPEAVRDRLVELMLQSDDPQELLLVRDALRPHADEVRADLWRQVNGTATPAPRRFRVLVALATLDPDSTEWPGMAPQVTEQLLAANPLHLALWKTALEPVRRPLLASLGKAFRDGREGERGLLAATFLADYARDQPDILGDLLLEADPRQYAMLLPPLRTYPREAVALLTRELEKVPPADASEDTKEALAKRQAQAAVALLQLGQTQSVWPLLRHSPDPRRRTFLIHRLGPLGTAPQALIQRLKEEPEVYSRRALLLSLGDFSPSQLSPSEQELLIPSLLQIYRDDPDPGLHGASEWILRKWQQGARLADIDKDLATGKIEGQRGWYVNGQQQTLVVVPGPSAVEMGSPPTEFGREGGAEGITERPKLKKINRSFAIATKEVTVKQFLLFNGKHNYNRQFARTQDCPVTSVRWYDAAAYCNWLSQQENIPPSQWCYLPNAEGKYAEGMKTAANYLSLDGYRLPTEAEWELACRAGSRTSRYYGESAELLGSYGWYTKNSLDQWLLPVGTLRPNDLGLFDMLGNAMEWTMGEIVSSSALADEKPGDDIEDPRDAHAITDTARISRGGSFLSYTLNVRAAFRQWIKPSFASLVIGFRPARTMR